MDACHSLIFFIPIRQLAEGIPSIQICYDFFAADEIPRQARDDTFSLSSIALRLLILLSLKVPRPPQSGYSLRRRRATAE
ncbi:hypothetical protein G3570_02725 [Balneolaceae bacterium YR4-1]|uniref:Uncharacterized protein n=1 Tax=Halalkalibaculum roseum TaxID=2709311 RepID=A0A6M1SJQ7_9BACT|nr:hypothetical protein [Halalkalibaculum roseum]